MRFLVDLRCQLHVRSTGRVALGMHCLGWDFGVRILVRRKICGGAWRAERQKVFKLQVHFPCLNIFFPTHQFYIITVSSSSHPIEMSLPYAMQEGTIHICKDISIWHTHQISVPPPGNASHRRHTYRRTFSRMQLPHPSAQRLSLGIATSLHG